MWAYFKSSDKRLLYISCIFPIKWHKDIIYLVLFSFDYVLSSPLSQQISMTFMTFLGQQIIESVIKYFQSISCYVFGKLSTFNYTTFRTNCTCKAKIFIVHTNTTNAQIY